MDYNRGQLMGRLKANPKYYPPGRKGQAHTNFTLAVNRVVPTETGPKADYFPCVIWGEEAGSFAEKRSKGDTVAVFGKWRTNYIEQADGTSKLHFELRVEKFGLGMKALKNLLPQPKPTAATKAVSQLMAEFGNNE